MQNNSRLDTKAYDNLAMAVQSIEERLRKGKLIGEYFRNTNALNVEKNNNGREQVRITG